MERAPDGSGSARVARTRAEWADAARAAASPEERSLTLEGLPPELLATIGAKLYMASKRSLFQLSYASHAVGRDVPTRAAGERRQSLAERALRLLVADVPATPEEAALPEVPGFKGLPNRLSHMFGTEEGRAAFGRPSPLTAKWVYVLGRLLFEQRKPLCADLLDAVEALDEPRVASLIAAGADADYFVSEQRSWYSGDDAITSPLSIIVRAMLTDGVNPVRIATLRRLLESGANINRNINASGKKVLADGKHVDLISCAGIDQLAPATVLTRVAILHGALEPLELAIRYGADVNYVGEHRGYRWAAIHLATAALNQPVAEMLISAGALLRSYNAAPGPPARAHDRKSRCKRVTPIQMVCNAWREETGSQAKEDLERFLAFLPRRGARQDGQQSASRDHRAETSVQQAMRAAAGKADLVAVLVKLGGTTPDRQAERSEEEEEEDDSGRQHGRKGKKKATAKAGKKKR